LLHLSTHLHDSRLHLVFIGNYNIKKNMDKMIHYRVFNLRGHRAIPKSMHALMTLGHKMVF
jgi:hypothetical protein